MAYMAGHLPQTELDHPSTSLEHRHRRRRDSAPIEP
jgi:hypothetical protein